jgi:hypothetical protein
MAMSLESPGSHLQSPATERAHAIRTSLRAFVCGLIGLVPVLGFFPGVYGLLLWFRVPKGVWNPANKYLGAAVLMGMWSILSTALLTFAIIIALS